MAAHYQKPCRRTASDADLVRAGRGGDRASLGLLFERYRPRLYGAALRIVGYRSEAEDAVHDAFVTALARLTELQDPGAVGGWLHAILRNRCLEELRIRKAHPCIEDAETCLRHIPDEAMIEERVSSKELREWVFNALARMPEALRVTVLLRYFGSYDSYTDLSAILGVPVGTVRSRLHDAKAKLANLLLQSAGLAGEEGRLLADERLRFYDGAFRSLYQGRRDAFLSHYAADLHVVWSSGKTAQGRCHFDAEIDEDLRVGVRLVPQRVIASGNTTVLEGVFVNPPEDPEHCPPGVALVLFESAGQIGRLHLHLAPRPPRPNG